MNHLMESMSRPALGQALTKAGGSLAVLLLSLILAAPCARAEMIIDTTRVIYPEARREVTFNVSNVSKEKPALIQMWVDDGVNTASPEDVVTPFNISPPVARIGVAGTQVVRVVYTGDPLASDRESLYWFNMLEVPPKSNAENRLTFAIRTRIKLFFRPKGLKGDPVQAMDKVTWKVVKQGNGWVIEGDNPTPFHMSFLSLNLGEPGQLVSVTEGGMLKPMSHASFPITQMDKLPQKYSLLVADFINDFGGVNSTSFTLATPK